MEQLTVLNPRSILILNENYLQVTSENLITNYDLLRIYGELKLNDMKQ